jgi:hypothetical protein
LKVFPRTFVVAGYSLKIRTGNLCGDSRRAPLLVQLMMSFQDDQLFIREQVRVLDLDCFSEKVLLTEEFDPGSD